ncbi:hypothetical protein K504DRAFT_461303 [Pleomassaria siparia CBS 279.74]|uniref:NAD dependent epimerase/dehydratase n=1 Tax=Pleomassaria siparia CBS 279.74 TaxID=1314801 RepID=A0A6G1JVL3_9PLEO|nr:hypothetical protein K504DRAFT_461303 [Pleomassaria siparia CBS 279.74]
MGAQPSTPRPGTEFQVIGAGLSRTGTASFSEALRILLEGPVYHGGTQTTLGPPIEIKSMIQILAKLFHHPKRTDANEQDALQLLKERFNGYVAATDAPASGLVPEILRVYPNAKVICTVRDAKAWGKSMDGVTSVSTMAFLSFILFPIPGMRHFPDYINKLREQWATLYGDAGREPVTVETYERHIAWLKSVVPEEQLVFFSVKDGWEPLCKALGKPVPKDIPFPRINDGEAINRLAKRKVTQGLIRWLIVVATAGLALIPMIWI